MAVKKVAGTYYGSVDGNGWHVLVWNVLGFWWYNYGMGTVGVYVYSATPTIFLGRAGAVGSGTCYGMVN